MSNLAPQSEGLGLSPLAKDILQICFPAATTIMAGLWGVFIWHNRIH